MESFSLRGKELGIAMKNFNDYFDKTYYSCRIGMRKPDRNIFELVLDVIIKRYNPLFKKERSN